MSEEIKKCENCGAKNQIDDLFCKECGNKINSTISNEQVDSQENIKLISKKIYKNTLENNKKKSLVSDSFIKGLLLFTVTAVIFFAICHLIVIVNEIPSHYYSVYQHEYNYSGEYYKYHEFIHKNINDAANYIRYNAEGIKNLIIYLFTVTNIIIVVFGFIFISFLVVLNNKLNEIKQNLYEIRKNKE